MVRPIGWMLLCITLLVIHTRVMANTDPPRYVVRHWTAETGLPVNGVNALARGPDGYLWLATYDGLVRFDGVRFEIFDSANYDALTSNRLLVLTTQQHALWITTEQRDFIRFDRQGFRKISSATTPPGRAIHIVVPGADNKLWIGGTSGLAHTTPAESLKPVPIVDKEILAIWPTGRMSALIGTRRDGLWQLAGDRFTRLATDTLPENIIFSVVRDNAGRTWIGTPGGLYQLNGQAASKVPWPGEPRSVYSLIPAPDGRLWIGTNQGVFLLENGTIRPFGDVVAEPVRGRFMQQDREGNAWVRAGRTLYRNGEPAFTANSFIRDFLIDHEGSLWLATTNSGLYQLRESPVSMLSKQEGLPDDNLYGLFEDKDESIWLGSMNSGAIQLTNGQVSRVIGTSEGARSKHVWTIARGPSGSLWLGGYGLCRLIDGRCSTEGVDPHLRNGQVRAVFSDSRGRLWAGAESGLFRRDAGGWRKIYPATASSPYTPRIIREGRDGTIWVGTNGDGLLEIHEEHVRRWTTRDGLSSNLIRAIHEDEHGVLWVGTENRGINRLVRHGETMTIHSIRQRNGLFDDTIHQILPDNMDRLWMSSNRGIFWVEKQILEDFADGKRERIWAISYSESEGLRNREANGGVQAAGIRRRNGSLWFPTQEGVAIIHPAAAQRNLVPPDVTIESLVATDESMSPGDSDIVLETHQRTFAIHYTATTFVDPGKVRFKYKLEGIDDHWVNAGNRRVAYYTQIPPGEYRFRVMADNGHDVWSKEGATIDFTVTPLYYERLSIQVLAVLLLCTSLAILIWRRFAQHQAYQETLERVVEARTKALVEEKNRTEQILATVSEQAEALQKADELKTRSFAHINHEFRTPLTLIQTPLEELLTGRQGELPASAEAHLHLMLRSVKRLNLLVDEILELCALESGIVKPGLGTHDVGLFVRNILMVFTPYAKKQRISVIADVSSLDGISWVFDAEKMERVLNNLLSNAIKFTPQDGQVAISAQVEDRSLVIRIMDTGIGIDGSDVDRIFDPFYRTNQPCNEQRKGTGLGLPLAKLVTELHGGTITVDSRLGRGSSFQIRLPNLPIPDIDLDVSPDTCNNDSSAANATAIMEVSDVEHVHTNIDHGKDKSRILVVDDSRDMCLLIRQCLEPQFSVLCEYDGETGIQQARRSLPDLIIADLIMPHVNGFQLIQALKNDPDTATIPVLMLTGQTGVKEEMQGLRNGALYYLTKPFDATLLRVRVETVIERQKHLRNKLQAEIAASRNAPRQTRTEPFEARVRRLVRENLHSEDFSVEQLASLACTSRSQLFRRMKKTMGISPQQLISQSRLEQAAILLTQGMGSISEIAYAVGFRSFAYFSTSFRKHFGVSPSEYLARPRSEKQNLRMDFAHQPPNE